MTAAPQPRTSGPARRGQSRFAPPSRTCRRGPHSWTARPANRLAAQKTAPGIFLAPARKTRHETVSLTLGTHQESSTYVFVFAPGCVVVPNSGDHAAVYPQGSSPFPAGTPEAERALIGQFRTMADQTKNGRNLLGYTEKKGYGYAWTDDVNGGVDATNKLILLPRASWQDSAWTMIHEATHIYDAFHGQFSSDQGWLMFREGEMHAYRAELGAYQEYRSLPGNGGYQSPGTQAVLDLYNTPGAFVPWLDQVYKPIWGKK